MSYTAASLPPALLELTLLRVANASSVRVTGSLARQIRRNRALGWRGMHEAVALDPTRIPGYEKFMGNGYTTSVVSTRDERLRSGGALTTNSLDKRKGQMQSLEELERRVQALDQAIETEEISRQPFFYTENDLMAMYQAVLAVPVPDAVDSDERAASKAVKQAVAITEAEADSKILKDVYQRLCSDASEYQKAQAPYRRILLRVHEIVSAAEHARLQADPDAAVRPSPFPLGVLSTGEFDALRRTATEENDYVSCDIVLKLAKMAGLPIPEIALEKIVKHYAAEGNIDAVNKLFSDYLTETPTETQRHLHVQAHLNATPKEALPISALNLIHHYEELGTVVSMRTYTSVITALFSRPSSLARAHAWDLFTHMRYVAHPNPDVLLYTLMIRACASPVSVAYSSEPEKALDLWTEMTVDQKIAPTVGSYNAVILACAKSGTKAYINEAFRLARQMLDSHRDAHGISAFRPDRKTFCALLEGTKRIGDLARARWILAEMVRGGREDRLNPVEVEIDDEVMMHVFHAYAAYKPPFIRSAAPLVTQDIEDEQVPKTVIPAVQTPDEIQGTNLIIEEEEAETSFAHIPPQSHLEVIQEAKILFNRILRDHSTEEFVPSPSLPFSDKKFRNVELSARLASSYLSVFYKHASLKTAQALFGRMFKELKFTKSPRILVEALETCASRRQGPERHVALGFSDELWKEWAIMENVGRDSGKPLNSRLVERAHVARIRLLALTENINSAMKQIRSFAEKYPPGAIKTPTPKLTLQSTRTSLVGQRPLVRVTSTAEVPDDNVPPLLTFRDIEVLHHRLIMGERGKDIGYITWLCKAYEWALRIRRDEAVKTKFLQKEALVAV